ncbi:MAG: gamma-glutamyltransferase family protein [Gammaproteobacteria bacterium]|nr:gamma-glutamyltransferase family protein [Gammaproteobacteria bacterium]MBT6042079.1 gamma-glutamyltransferase family protein [Gammaproteobacteria bacterium]
MHGFSVLSVPDLFAVRFLIILLFLYLGTSSLQAQEFKHSKKPPLHGQHWVAVGGKPLTASAGSRIFNQGGNAVDAASAMLAVSATIWDTMGWGGETQALIHDPRSGKVIAINALGAAPTNATPEKYRSMGMAHPPDYGPLAAVIPGTPGGLLVMLAEYGSMSLTDVLAPAMELAEGYPIEQVKAETIQLYKDLIKLWPDSKRVLLPHYNPLNPNSWSAPRPGEIFRQPELLNTLVRLVDAEQQALQSGLNRKEAIYAAYERFYRGDIATEMIAAIQDGGGLITLADLDQWQVYIEEPVSTTYKGIEVFKLNSWVQGPVMLQMLNMLENYDVKGMGYNSPEYIHTLYQVMNLAFADRDFYYGDPYYPPVEPIAGLLSKDYARQRINEIDKNANQILVKPGDPYPFQGESNPYSLLLEQWQPVIEPRGAVATVDSLNTMDHDQGFLAGTTSIQTADKEGWVVSITPSGGWIPAYIAGTTGIGLSQRLQSFVMSPDQNPFNVMEPGKRPRATLTPSMALKNGAPFLSFAVQGGDTQEQNLLQFFLNIVEFGMDVQQATEAANINSYQVHSSFGNHAMQPGRLVLRADTSIPVRLRLGEMGYQVETEELTSGPINGIFIDQRQGSMMGGSSNYGDDYGIAW